LLPQQEDKVAQQCDLKISPNPSSNITTVVLYNQTFNLQIADLTRKTVFGKRKLF